MDTVIKKLSEIENAATSVMDKANASKKEFSQQMEEKTSAFDRDLEAQTEKQIQELHARMESDMEKRLAQQKTLAQAQLENMQKHYDTQHAQYAAKLFQELIKE